MIRRREFLTAGGKAIVASGLVRLGECVPSMAHAPQAASARLSGLAVELERQIPVWMEKARVPGVGIAIIEQAGLAWRRSFGLKDAASKVRVDDETLFEAASMSKPVFAYLVMKLCEAGVLNLDVPLTKYSSDRFLDGDSRLDLITARHVLSHSSGFQNWRSDKTPLALHFTPGEKYLYSGEGYNYLQTVVTKLIGQPFETYMRDRLLAPLGMTSSRYVWDDTAARRMARPHDVEGKPIDNKKSTPQGVARYGSAGALLTTPGEYARFVIDVIAPKPADRFHLSRESVREMLRPHVKVDGGQYPASWALGWQVFHNQRDFIYHGGDNAGFHCAAVASVEGRSGFVAMTNGDNGSTVLRELLMADLMQAFLAA